MGPGFAKLLTASGISNIGDGIMGAAFPLLVAVLTRDPLLVAGATLASRLPWFLFALISGALVDRMDRRRVMVVTDILRAVGVAFLALALITNSEGLVMIYIVAFGLGVAETFFDTSAEALVPALVQDDNLPKANGRIQALEWVTNSFVGPPVGAFLFAIAAGLPFLLNAGSFAIAAALIAWIPGRFRAERTTSMSLKTDIGEGLRWLWSQKVVRTLAIMAGITNMFTFGIIAIFVLYAQDTLGVGDIGFGILLATLGIGGLVGALVAPAIVNRIGPGTTVQLTVVVGIVVTVALGFATNAWVAGALMMFYAFGVTGWNVVSVSLRQTLTPDPLRGRVSGAARLLAWGTQPIGALLGGVIAAWLGLRAPFFIAAAAWIVMVLVTLPIVNNRTIAEAKEPRPLGDAL